MSDRRLALVRRKAATVRLACETLLSPLELPDRDGKTLGGYCVTAALGVTNSLREVGVRASLVLGKVGAEFHFWTDIGDRIVDVTATQFGHPSRVRLCRLPASYRGNPCDQYRMAACDATLWRSLPDRWWAGKARPFTLHERRAIERAFDAAYYPDAPCATRYSDLLNVSHL